MAEPRRSAGFTLVEALVALVVAGFLLPSLARALAGAWTATRTPMEIVSAMVLARDAAGGSDAAVAAGRDRGFTVQRSSAPVEVDTLPADVAPAPAGADKDDDGLDPKATPASMRLAIPKSFGAHPPGAAAAQAVLRRISVVVRTPSGRRIAYDGVKLDDAPR